MSLIFQSLLLRQQRIPVRPCLSLLSSSSSSSLFSTTPPSSPPTSTKEFLSKHDLALEIANTHDLTMAKSERILNTLLDTVVQTVTEGRAVRLSKFGSFESFDSKARIGRNPNTGEKIDIPAKRRVRFKASTAFKTSTNGKPM